MVRGPCAELREATIKENAFVPLYINYMENLPGFDPIPARSQRVGAAGL